MKKNTLRLGLAAAAFAAIVWAQRPAQAAASSRAGQDRPASQSTQHVSPARLSGIVQGTVKDDTGGVIPGAVVTLTDSVGKAKTTTTAADGTYTFRGVTAGSYTVLANYTGLQQTAAVPIKVSPGQSASGNIVMTVQTQKQEVTVTDTTNNQVSTEASNNASALV